jgi:hypothetical protein
MECQPGSTVASRPSETANPGASGDPVPYEAEPAAVLNSSSGSSMRIDEIFLDLVEVALKINKRSLKRGAGIC